MLISLAVLGLAVFGLLSLASPPALAAEDGVRVVTHAVGQTEITGTPERIVALEFSFVDALASLHVTPVGIADDGDAERIIPQIRSQIGTWTSVGTRAQPNLEIISALKPDHIIADLERHKGIYDSLQRIAPTIVLPSLQATYEDNLEAMLIIGEALNRKDAVQARLDQHHAKMEALADRTPQNEQRKILAAVVWDKGFNAHTSSAYTLGVLEVVGMSSAIQSSTPYANLNLEQLVQINPDVMFLMTSGENTLADQWASNPLWKAISAVRNGDVYEVDRNLWSRFRGIISAELIAEEAVNLLY